MNYEKIAKKHGFIYDSARKKVYDTESRGQYDYFDTWEDACVYYGLDSDTRVEDAKQ